MKSKPGEKNSIAVWEQAIDPKKWRENFAAIKIAFMR